MGCDTKNQSSISEVRDQLFLDTADGGRLNNVSGNLGLDRPGLGFGDDEWRAVTKLIALQPKMLRSQFLKLIETCLGPQYARIGTLYTATLVDDLQLSVIDSLPFVQLGTVVIDPTLATEETVGYCFRNSITGEFLLKSALTQPHTIIAPGSARLRADASIGATSLLMVDSSTLPGVFPYPIILDQGTLIEEIVKVTANNTGTDTLTLAVGTVFAHAGPVTQYVNSRIALPVVKSGSGDTIGGAAPNMTLTDAGALFAAGDIGSYLTISGATTKANNGTFIITAFGGPTVVTYTNAVGAAEAFPGSWELTRNTATGRTFVPLEAGATRKFPESGFVRINHNGGGSSDEVAEYEFNEVDTNTLLLKGVLAHAHHNGESVELVLGGAVASVAQVVEYGVHWQLRETDPRHVQIILPSDSVALRLLDASWLHRRVPAAFSTTASATANIGDEFLRLTSVSGLPNESGMLTVGAAKLFYTLKLTTTDVTATVSIATLAGATQIIYLKDPNAMGSFPTPVGYYRVVIDPGGGNQEFITVKVTDLDNSKLTFTTALVNPHNIGETVRILDQVLLDLPLLVAIPITTAVVLFTTPYVGTVLSDGNYLDGSNNLQLNHFPGGYIFDATDRGISEISTFLTQTVPPPVNVASNQLAGFTNIEVNDASLWLSPPFSPYDVRVGASSGFQEDRTLIDRTLKADIAARLPTVQVGSAPLDTTLNYQFGAGASPDFPESNGLSPAGYRIIINPGAGNQEIALVFSNNISTTVFTLVNPLTLAHLATEPIYLLNDVLTTDVLQNPHSGPVTTTLQNTFGEEIIPFIDELFVSPAPTNFPSTNGTIYVNFGKEKLNIRHPITNVLSSTQVEIEYFEATNTGTDDYPTADYPYQVIIGDGFFIEEKGFVTLNTVTTTPVTGGVLRKNTITFSVATTNTHVVGEYVKFISGNPEVLEYQTKNILTSSLTFNPPILLEDRHLVGERVIYSPAASLSNVDGSSFGFKLPPDPARCATALVELLRAAGVQVTFMVM